MDRKKYEDKIQNIGYEHPNSDNSVSNNFYTVVDENYEEVKQDNKNKEYSTFNVNITPSELENFNRKARGKK